MTTAEVINPWKERVNLRGRKEKTFKNEEEPFENKEKPFENEEKPLEEEKP